MSKKNIKGNFLKQDVLRDIELLCTQEELPSCSATCPMHINLKEINKNISKEDFIDAYKIFSRNIHFPKILAFTCDAPCEKKCKRNSLGGSIEISKLEKALALKDDSTYKKPFRMPSNNNTVAIIGSELAGLTAAFDLALKGYKVTIFEKEDKLGGSLWNFENDILPKEILEKELSKIDVLSINIIDNSKLQLNTIDDIKKFMDDNKFDAIFISLKNIEFYGEVDNNTLRFKDENIFAGTRVIARNKKSTVYDMYDGKSAAISIDRVLKNVSIMAGREAEGPKETKLFVNTSNIEHKKAIKSKNNVFEDNEAINESKRCIQCECMECVKGCAFMQSYNSYPKKMVREVYNNLSIAMGTHHANKMINTCNLCNQCESICPNGLNMADVFLEARRIMVETKKMPPSAHEFALLDMEYSNSEDFFMIKHQPKHDTSKYLFFPSCQLPASEPELTQDIYKDLCNILSDGVGLMLGCCGIVANWAGEEETFEKNINKIKLYWEKFDKPKLITACPMCLKTLKEYAEIDIIGIWEIDKLFNKNEKMLDVQKFSIHDACGARYDNDIQNKIRKIATDIGYELEEPKFSKENSACCGYGGLTPISDRKLANKITENIKNQSDKPILTYCVNCRDRLLEQGKDAYHILEIAYNNYSKIKRKSPTWSERQENRKIVKNYLLRELWEINTMDDIDCKLYIDKELEDKLDERMILHSDIQKAILNAERTKDYFFNSKKNCFVTGFSPNNVTFWIEYSKEEDGYKVLNAYSHRMTIKNLK